MNDEQTAEAVEEQTAKKRRPPRKHAVVRVRFRDKRTGEMHRPGEHLELSKTRLAEIRSVNERLVEVID